MDRSEDPNRLESSRRAAMKGDGAMASTPSLGRTGTSVCPSIVRRAAMPIAGYDANEADHHEPDRQAAFWGANCPRPLAGKRR